ncbi:MAG: corrinoid protein [Candidatus Marinimicrobia bacterium]|nr:corrinoid protein [Candidatus Neomarinimicrobiota bacterium]
MEILNTIAKKLIAGNANEVVDLINEALGNGLKADTILNDGLLEGMAVIGKRFKEGSVYIPEVLIAARAMNRGLEILDPLLAEEGAEPRGKLLIGTVQGDLHDIGKNLVSILFRGAGFQIIDLGTNITPAVFVEKAKEHKPDVIGLSALLTTTMINMGATIKVLREEDIIAPVIVGGAPLTQEFADSIGADMFASSASDGIEKVLQAMS